MIKEPIEQREWGLLEWRVRLPTLEDPIEKMPGRVTRDVESGDLVSSLIFWMFL